MRSGPSEPATEEDLASSSSYESESEEERTQRYQGHASTWRAHNAAEIDTSKAHDEIRDRNLSIHLYNAFALKHRHDKSGDAIPSAPVPGRDTNAATGETIQHDTWVPPQAWTAWPMSVARVPPQDFLRSSRIDLTRSDPVERMALRMPFVERPSSDLKDEIAASVTRIAKKRFISRQWIRESIETREIQDVEANDEDSDSEEGSQIAVKNEQSRSQSAATNNDEMDLDEDETTTRAQKARRKLGLDPIVSADDEHSRRILDPSIRHIMAKLDNTLIALHNAQEAALGYLSDTSASDSEAESVRSRSRSRQPSVNKEAKTLKMEKANLDPEWVKIYVQQHDPEAAPAPTGGKQGRPKKKYAREPGETDIDYVVRVARIRKEKAPFRAANIVSSPVKATSAEMRSGTSARGSVPPTPRRAKTIKNRARRLQPRNWTDVLNAASLAGFSPQVLDRAARRCADLFGQTTSIHTFQEMKHDQSGWSAKQDYEPGMVMPELLVGDMIVEDEPSTRQSRQVSRAPSSLPGESEVERFTPSSRTNNKVRNRSRSASAGGDFACRVPGCPRAAEPFGRRTNLVRHMKLVHRMTDADVDVDSEDEMYGAVHVDGFMKPIRPKNGWRRSGAAAQADEGVEAPRKKKRARPRREEE